MLGLKCWKKNKKAVAGIYIMWTQLEYSKHYNYFEIWSMKLQWLDYLYVFTYQNIYVDIVLSMSIKLTYIQATIGIAAQMNLTAVNN